LNQLSEAHYTLYYTPNSDGYFTANQLSVDLVILENSTYSSNYCGDNTSSNAF